MEAGVEAIKVVTRHSMDREKGRKDAAAARTPRVVCTRCGEPMPAGAQSDWVIYRTWIVFSETGATGLDSEEHRCPRCEREAAGSPQSESLPPALPQGR